MGKIPIALQLYSIRELCEKDLPGTLKAVAKMGYDGVEFAGYYGRSANELRKMLDDLGLKCAGTHLSITALFGDEFKKTVEFNKTIGNPNLIVPGLPREFTSSRNTWYLTALLFNELAEKAKGEGMRVGYHNHYTEFQPLDGEMPLDTFFGNVRKDVIMQFDVGNARHGGGDASVFLKKYPGRAVTVHVKEYSTTNDTALIGEGDVNWAEIFALCEEQGVTEWYIVEQESYAHPPLECVDLCLKNLREMGK